MSLVDRVAERRSRTVAGRKGFVQPPFWSLDTALQVPVWGSGVATEETLEADYESLVDAAFKGDSIIFGLITRRAQVFSQGRPAWQRDTDGRPQRPFSSPALDRLRRPWASGSFGELLTLMEIDGSLAGNAYWTQVDDAGRFGSRARGAIRLARMRPDWTTLIIDAPSGDPFGLDAHVVGHSYLPRPHGRSDRPRQTEPLILLPDEVCHYTPIPDPTARFRGMSWVTAAVKEVMADRAATDHKLRFFQNGATPTHAIKFDKDTAPEAFQEFVARYNATHRGTAHAYKTLFLTGGADIVPMSVDLKQIDFKVTQGAGETRMAVDAGVPAAIAGISEGLGGSSLNAGNFSAARRLFGHTTLADLWLKAAPAIETLIPVGDRPGGGAYFVIDTRDAPFMQEDAGDAAAIRAADAQTMRSLGDGGWAPDSIRTYLATGDVNVLVHTGLVPVQLQPPGTVAAGPGGADGARGGPAATLAADEAGGSSQNGG